MRRFKFAKLVRDKIVESIVNAGNRPVWRVLVDDEYIEELKRKVHEEAGEIPETKNKNDLVSEIADLQEAIDALLTALGVSKEELTKIRKIKNEKNGAFDTRHYVDYVETTEGNKWEEYYTKNSDRYPEMSD